MYFIRVSPNVTPDIDMTIVSVPLPEALADRIHRDAAARGYASDAEFLAALIESAYKRDTQRGIEALLDEALEGTLREFSPSDWERYRANVLMVGSSSAKD
jgi:hypothetical protein